jgi:hypothetical protein
MGDQPPLRIHHKGMTAFADLDLRDHVPDQLEVHLGDPAAPNAMPEYKTTHNIAPRANELEFDDSSWPESVPTRWALAAAGDTCRFSGIALC